VRMTANIGVFHPTLWAERPTPQCAATPQKRANERRNIEATAHKSIAAAV
jgi:hypothetical protein